MSARVLLSLLLGLCPGAQAAVMAGRAVASPAGAARAAAPLHAPPAPLALPSLDVRPLAAAPALTLPAPVLTPVPAPLPAALPAAAAARLAPAPPAPLRAPDPAAARLAEQAAAEPRQARSTGEDAGGRPAFVSRRFAELEAAFETRPAPEDAPLAAAATRRRLSAPAPAPRFEAPPPAGPPAPAPPRSGLAKPLVFFLLALVVAQVGIEAQTAALPPLIAQVFGDASVAADAGLSSSIGDIIGVLLTPAAVKLLGLKRAYLFSTAARVATGGLIAGLLATGALSLAGLMALMALDAVLLGVAWTTEKSIPAVVLDQDQAKLERYKATRQIAIEGAATLVPIATGAVIAAWGFLPALAAFPLAVTASITLVALTLRLPAKLAGAAAAELPPPGSGPGFFRSLARGGWAILKRPALLWSGLAYSFVYAPLMVIYWVVAPAFALNLVGPGAAQEAAAYSGMITGLYSLGGILAGLLLMRAQRRPQTPEDMRRSMLFWTAAAAVAASAFLSLALPFSWGSITAPALAFFLFAIPQIMAKLKLESFFQSRAPKGAVEDATTVLELASSLAITLALWWFGRMLDGTAIVSLGWLAASIAPLAAILLAATFVLSRVSRRTN